MARDELSNKIIGCAENVYHALGNGFEEVIYKRCLAMELEKVELSFERDKEYDIYYDGIAVGKRRADFVVENKVILELKAVINLEDVHLAQTKNYVIAYGFEKGLLINFGATDLQYKLIFNSRINKNLIQEN